MKYLILRAGGSEFPLIFPDLMRHRAQVPRGMEHAVVSAGHVQILGGGETHTFGHVASLPQQPAVKVYVSGGSGTLGIDCRPEDAQIILSGLTHRTG